MTEPDAFEAGESDATETPKRGDYIDSRRRGYDPALRPYRIFTYVTFTVVLLWLCLGMIISVVQALWS